jgi:hypothetical protein
MAQPIAHDGSFFAAFSQKAVACSMRYHKRYNVRYPPPPTRKKQSCLTVPVIVGVMVLVLVQLYLMIIRPMIGDYIGNRLVQQVGMIPQISTMASDDDSTRQTAVVARVEQTIPTAIAALPPGNIVMTEDRINAYLAAHPEQLAPLDAATISFLPGVVHVDMTAMGTNNIVTFGLRIAPNGRIVAVDPQLSGPIGMFISFDTLVATMEEHINKQFATQRRTFQAVRIDNGSVTVTIE